MKRFSSAAAALLLLAVACGGGGGGGGGGADDPTLDAGPRDDEAIAREANLRISDFPDEWRAAPLPPGSAAASAENDRAFADCMGRPRPEEIRVASADSEDFSAQDTRRASSSVQLVRTADIATADFVALRGDKAPGCLKAQIDAEFARQLPADAAAQTTIERVELPQFGEETVGFRVQAMNLVQGVQVRTYIDLTFVRKGKMELSGAFLNRTTPFPAELERTLLQRMVGRA